MSGGMPQARYGFRFVESPRQNKDRGHYSVFSHGELSVVRSAVNRNGLIQGRYFRE